MSITLPRCWRRPQKHSSRPKQPLQMVLFSPGTLEGRQSCPLSLGCFLLVFVSSSSSSSSFPPFPFLFLLLLGAPGMISNIMCPLEQACLIFLLSSHLQPPKRTLWLNCASDTSFYILLNVLALSPAYRMSFPEEHKSPRFPCYFMPLSLSRRWPCGCACSWRVSWPSAPEKNPRIYWRCLTQAQRRELLDGDQVSSLNRRATDRGPLKIYFVSLLM